MSKTSVTRKTSLSVIVAMAFGPLMGCSNSDKDTPAANSSAKSGGDATALDKTPANVLESAAPKGELSPRQAPAPVAKESNGAVIEPDRYASKSVEAHVSSRLDPPASASSDDSSPAIGKHDHTASQLAAAPPNPLRGGNDIAVDPSAQPANAVAEVQATPDSRQTTAQPPNPAADGPATSKHSGIPFDPIKENGRFFVDWPKPKAALVFTGRLDGYLEPCGCAGFDRMKGGLSRRAALIDMLRGQGWPVVAIDVGGNAKGFGKQPELKYRMAVDAFRVMKYGAVGLGTPEFQLPPEEVLAMIAPVDKQKSSFICGNVGLFGFDDQILPRTQFVSTDYKRLGITSIVGKKYLALIANKLIVTADPDVLLDMAVPVLKKNADILILLADATKAETIELAKKYPAFSIVVTSDGHPEPPSAPQRIDKDGAQLIEVGEKGMYCIVIGLYDDPKQPIRYQRVTLDSRFAASPPIKKLMQDYQYQLKSLGFEGLGICAVPHPMKETSGGFVGSDTCADCHTKAYDIWKKSVHSKAYSVLENARPARNFDPECISCHVVGWNTTKFFPYETGYSSKEKTPKLLNVGCEDCHGPGEEHVNAEATADKARQERARKAISITMKEAEDSSSKKQNCYSCHDLDNSPEFEFKKYWPFVEHHDPD